MNKYSGIIGFGKNMEIEPGLFEDIITERPYRGDILKNRDRFNVSNTTSGDLKITNQFSIIGDKYAFDHVSEIRYLDWHNTRWIVESIEIEYPRLVMTIGGIYNGPQAKTADNP